LEAAYGLGLLSIDRSEMTRGGNRRGVLLTSAAFLGVMALVDAVIVIELADGRALMQSWGLRLGIALMLVTALALFVIAWRDPEWFRHTSDYVVVEAPAKAPSLEPIGGVEDDAARLLCQRFEALLAETQAHTEFGLSMTDVAKRLGVSPRQLSDAVNRVHAKGFRTLLNDKKVEVAARLLADPSMVDRTVTDIMFDAGFQTKSSFNKEFSGRMGATPSEYRQQMCGLTPMRNSNA
jgi:AraC-like DNA-binding protein